MQMLDYYPKLRVLATRQAGQGMVEYALILVLVSIVVIVILLTMGKQIRNVFSNVVAALG
jgi:pilus assembly protein Flp/PilA